MDPGKLIEGRSRETRIKRDARGRWWNGEDRIDHPNLIRSFNAWIDVAEDGRFCLRNDINWAYVAIEGPPLFVQGATITGDGGVEVRLSDGRTEPLAGPTLRQDAEGALYCDARGGRLPAKFTREATQSLADLIDEDAEGVFLQIGATRIRPPLVDDPLQPVQPGQPE